MRNSLSHPVRIIYNNLFRLIGAPRKHTLRSYNLILRAKTVVFTIVTKNPIKSAPSAMRGSPKRALRSFWGFARLEPPSDTLSLVAI